VAGVRERIALDKELGDMGVTQNIMLKLAEKCRPRGGLAGVLEEINYS
jgi:hypothetical protein